MNQLLALFRLDLKLFFVDRRALIMLFGVPIGLASFMGYLFNGNNKGSGPTGVNVVIVDLDQSAVSRGVVSNFTRDTTFQVTVTNESTAREWVLAGKKPVALVLPAGLGENSLAALFNTNRRPVITLLHDPSRDFEKSLVSGLLIPKLLQSVVQNAVSTETVRDYVRQGMDDLDRRSNLSPRDRQLYRDMLARTDDFLAARTNRSLFGNGGTNGATTADNSLGIPLPYTTQSVPLTHSTTGVYNGYAHSFAGMSLQFVLMSMLEMAVGLLRERESGMFRRLRSAPLARGTLLLAKGLSYACIALLSMGGCFVFAMLVFGVRIEGSWAGFAGCLVLASLMASSLGLTIAALGKTPAGTRGIGIAVMLLLVMIGGAWVPSFIFPKWLQTASMATPTRWAMDGFDAMTWRGLDFSHALVPMGILAAFTAVFGLVAWSRFRWSAE
ncbi:MAG TPA: ABC transporter permease [Candidatus Limnocylindria bacterium]|nr:ABC transporter permease [Candidatus Limnocylindria bacterium]